MGKFYEDLDTLNELIKKLEKKNEVSVFMIRVIRYAKENPEKSVSDIIKDIKKEGVFNIQYFRSFLKLKF